MELVEAALGGEAPVTKEPTSDRRISRPPAAAAGGGAGAPGRSSRAGLGPPVFDPAAGRRVELEGGETSRLLVAHPAPAPDDPAHVHLRLALAVLCSGRSSRIQRELVEENPLALWASAVVTGHRLGGMAVFSAEAAAGADAAPRPRR